MHVVIVKFYSFLSNEFIGDGCQVDELLSLNDVSRPGSLGLENLKKYGN